ncbi:MAG: ABC transporter substrate-binding protein [Sulfolobales archaeon]
MSERQRFLMLLAIIILLIIVSGHFIFENYLKSTTTAASGRYKIRVGIIPVIDSFMFIVAERENLFQKNNLDVELVFFGSARDRDSALISGQIDVAIHDPVGAVMLMSKNISIKIIGFVCCASDNDSNIGFYLLASPVEENQNILALNTISIAISRNTIIEYIAWEMLRGLNIDPGKVNFIDVPTITNRYELLIEGRIPMAVLPDPWGSLAIKNGAKIIARHRDLVVLVARKELLSDHIAKESIYRLINTLNEAIDLYNRDPNKYQSLINERLLIPQQLRDSFKLEWRVHISKTPKEVIDSVSRWLYERGLIDKIYSYSDYVEI